MKSKHALSMAGIPCVFYIGDSSDKTLCIRSKSPCSPTTARQASNLYFLYTSRVVYKIEACSTLDALSFLKQQGNILLLFYSNASKQFLKKMVCAASILLFYFNIKNQVNNLTTNDGEYRCD
jgi:hypothetical protein